MQKRKSEPLSFCVLIKKKGFVFMRGCIRLHAAGYVGLLSCMKSESSKLSHFSFTRKEGVFHLLKVFFSFMSVHENRFYMEAGSS